MAVRVVFNISPYVESEIMSQQNLSVIGKNLFQVKKILESLKHVFTLIVPSEFRPMFYQDKHLRAFVELVSSDTQSNIIFEKNIKDENCIEDDVSPQFVGLQNIFYTPRQIINKYIQKKDPILIDYSERTVEKTNCDSCTGVQLCGDVKSIQSLDLTLPSSEILRKIAICNRTNYERLQNKTSGWTLDDIKSIALFEAIERGVDITILNKISEIYISDSCMSDIRRLDFPEILNVAFSMFKCIAFVPVSDSNRQTFSIDWHPETTLSHHKEHALYRCDVVDPGRTGVGGSGTKRLLKGIKNGERVFLAYVNDHDFSEALIKQRIKSITK